MNDELRQGGVEHVVRELQSLGRCLEHLGSRVPRSSGRDERLGRIDRRDAGRPDARNQLRRE
jgi:hypothetical protein